ncbi:Putative phosphoserine phosphatase 2 [Polaromonas vacuolata]|uniref:Phosphoserine phosphatase 2 n=1 Tax=Polaromonas vacuolata TaxID=37448 RepID=A0A6H2H867_9BURK|nr:histidine phosphatase family protein [Polaromonas vacuolata]QJC56020.1 Putative phosphoserine phosphatase 2 [Polaromonas vacuolata]
MKLYLIRHALPLIKSGVCYGATDMAADAESTQQSANTLAKELPPGIKLVCSPMQRCRQLAQSLIKQRPELKLCIDERLVEMNFGVWEGQRWDKIARTDLDAWTANFRYWRCGGAESVDDILRRVGAAVNETRTNNQTTAWITHAGVIRATNLILSGQADIKSASEWPTQAPSWGGWCETEVLSNLA